MFELVRIHFQWYLKMHNLKLKGRLKPIGRRKEVPHINHW